jgi:SAM-dependent methyltransferase
MSKTMGFGAWKGKKVLEIGVGLGSDHLSFALNGAEMHALDLSREHLRHTQQHLAFHGLSTETTLGDAESMPYPAARFDAVYSFGVLHHTPNTELAVREIHRVLRPGGTAIVGLYHRDSFFFWLNTILANGIRNRGFLRTDLRGLLSEIEYRSPGNDAVPLVKVYSRREARALFSGFAAVEISTHHVDADHCWPFGRVLRHVPRRQIERRLSGGGWYLVIRAMKAADA